MDFKEYQKESRKTAVYPKLGDDFIFPTLGLAGEVGEVVEKVKKVIRDENGTMDSKSKEMIKKELGDVLWYMSQLASELGIDLDDIANDNINKINSRKIRGKLNGEGDNR